MNSPKAALELLGRYLKLTYTIDPLTPETRDKMEATIEAAIPVAELHEEAVDLLDKILALDYAPGEMGVHKYVARRLLKQIEALK